MSRLSALVALLLAAPAQAQSPFVRASDLRTSAPEAVLGQRKAWGADLTFGGSFNRGNTEVDYVTTGLALFAARAPHTAYLTGSMVYNTFGDTRVLNRGDLTLRYDRALAGPWKLFVFNTQAYNEFLRLDYRTSTGAGPWYDLDAGSLRTGLSAALVHQYERFKGGIVERAGRISLRALSRLPVSQVAELGADVYYAPSLDADGDYHLFAELSLQTRFWRDNLGIKVSWLEEYDSRPKPGVKPNDTLWLTSLTVHLGR